MNVNGEKALSQVLTLRLTAEQFQELQVTLRNYQVSGSFSDQLRYLLRRSFKDSCSFRRMREADETDWHRAPVVPGQPDSDERSQAQLEDDAEWDRFMRSQGIV